MTIFEFVGQFFFQNDVFKLPEDVSELGIRVFLANGLESFQTFLILQIWDKPKIPKTVLKTRLKIKETTYTLVSVKNIVVYLRSHSIRAFSVLLEDSLRIISEAWLARKNLKTDSASAHQN
jgi:hypothetical protein